MADLLPVVSDPAAEISPNSKMKLLGKTPSTFNRDGHAVGVPGWTSAQSTDQQVGRWAKDGRLGICVQTRNVRAIDIDISDPATAQQIADIIEMDVGKLPMRKRSNSGKCLLVFKMAGDFAKRVIKTPDGIIEFLATGQQFIAIGTHPSGVRYEWPGGLPTSIPTLTEAEFEGLWAGLASVFGIEGGSTTERTGAGPTQPRMASDINDHRYAWLIENEWATGYERDGRLHVRCPWEGGHSTDTGASSTTYFAAGVGGYEKGHFKCLHASCSARTDGDFDAATGYTAIDFDVIDLDEGDKAEGDAAAVRNAQRAPRTQFETERERSQRIGREGDGLLPTQRVMTGTEMLEELVFIEDGSRVSTVNSPRAVLPISEFRHAYAGSFDMVPTAAGRKTKRHRVESWLEHRDRKSVPGQTFAPGRPPFCRSPGGRAAQNIWQARTGAPPPDWLEIVQPFFDHLAYLVPDAAERGRFLDWLAHVEQDPGTLPSTHYLMVAKQTGIGRNWVAYALARVWAGYVTLGFDLSNALKSGFNGTLGGTLLAVVDELHEGGPGGSNKPAAERLKSMLTEHTRLVNPKYGRQHVEFNCTRFLMFSNHEAALPLGDNDRRVVVIENPSERKDAAYYRDLYAHLDHPELGAALAESFRLRDISKFNPGEVAPMSAAKARTVRAGRSEVEQAVRDVASDWPGDCITSGALTTEVGVTLGGKSWNVQTACVAAGLVKYPKRVRIDGCPSHVWILRNVAGWSAAASTAVAVEVQRGQFAEMVSQFA